MGSIVNIALKSIKKAMHDKMFIGVILIFIIILPSLPILLYGDGTAQGHLKLYLTYSLYFIMFFVSITAIFISCMSLNEELEKKQMFLLCTKPVEKWKIVLGFWLGAVLITLILIIAAALINYGGIKWIISRYEPSLSALEMDKIKEQLLSSRKSVYIEQPDIKKIVSAQIADYKKEHKGESFDYQELEKKFKRKIFYETFCVPPRYEKKWTVKGLNNLKTDTVTIKFKYFSSEKPKDATISAEWSFGDPLKARQQNYYLEKSPEIYHSFNIPVSAIDKDGNLLISFTNLDNSYLTVIFPEKNGIEIMFHAGSFFVNFCKSYLLIFCQICVLCAIGVFFSSFLSFPVAVLMSLFMYALGTQATYFLNLLTQSGSSPFEIINTMGNEKLSFLIISQKIIAYMIYAFPHLDAISPVPYITDGRVIEINFLLRSVFIIIFVKSGFFLLTGSLIFNRKEIARVIV
ncbi:ABC transporter permease subunit [bacterium]|nr:ABC transporter permease subunit [bacterium]